MQAAGAWPLSIWMSSELEVFLQPHPSDPAESSSAGSEVFKVTAQSCVFSLGVS